jgi:hypothetical protein
MAGGGFGYRVAVSSSLFAQELAGFQNSATGLDLGVYAAHSSGKVTRHRLNPGGDRQANHALWRIVFTRLGSDPATRAYAERRTAEGKSKAEIIRCLKRYAARQVYPHLRPAAG